MALSGTRSLWRAQGQLSTRVLTTWASSTWSTAVTSQQPGLSLDAVHGQGNADQERGISTLPSGISRVAALPQAAQLALTSRSQQASMLTVAAVTSSDDVGETKPRQAPAGAGKGARPGEASQTATAAAMSDPKRIKRTTKATRAPAQADATPAASGSRDQTAAVQVKEKPKVQTRRPKAVEGGAKAASAKGASQKGWRLAAWLKFLNTEIAQFRGKGVNLNDKKKEIGQQWQALSEEKKQKFAP